VLSATSDDLGQVAISVYPSFPRKLDVHIPDGTQLRVFHVTSPHHPTRATLNPPSVRVRGGEVLGEDLAVVAVAGRKSKKWLRLSGRDRSGNGGEVPVDELGLLGSTR
jgi:hypothetical protein